MTGMAESGAVKHALGDRIGDDRAGLPCDDVGDGLTNRSQGRVCTGVIGLARLRGCRMAGGHDRQCVLKCTERLFSANVGDLNA